MVQQSVREQEVAWLRQTDWSKDNFAEACNECDYHQVFDSKLAKSLLSVGEQKKECVDLRSFLVGLEREIQDAALSEPLQFQILLFGITLLNAFLQVNYTGPALTGHEAKDLLPPQIAALPRDTLHGMVLEELVIDGERPYPLVENLLYLLLALKVINHGSLSSLASQSLWQIRVSFVHQKLLDDPVSSIHNIICDEESVTRVDYLVGQYPELKAKWHIEMAHYYSYYSYDQKAMFQVREAQRVSGLSMQVSGALGRRTKFQTFDVSQLVVLAKSASTTTEKHADSPAEIRAAPIALNLDDDTLLEKVSFSTTNHEAPYSKRFINPVAPIVPAESLPAELAALDPGDQPQLSLVDQCILLAYAGVIKVSAASDDQIIIEQVAAYIARVLQKPIDPLSSESNWSINSAALLARTRVEGHRSRTVERSVLQLQALVDQLVDEMEETGTLPNLNANSPVEDSAKSVQAPSFLRRADQTSAPAKERLAPIFSLPLASKWDLQLELARKYTSIGLVKSALEIFERLESWEQVAMCHGVMDREDKAEAILRQQIEAARPGADLPKLWCLLGDVTRDASYWRKSWEVSGKRYARAQRSLGKDFFAQGRHAEAIEAYALSLKINPLNHGAWFTYGCAALETTQFQVAAEAFTRCISIDGTDGESWNNLASALLRLGGSRKRDAWQALKTATELKYDSWRMWENYMLVSLDCLEFGESVRAMRRCIELRGDRGEAAIDLDVLRLLVQEVISEPIGSTGKEHQRDGNHAQPPDAAAAATNDDDDDDDKEGEDALRGLPRMVYTLMTETVQPLITHDPRLWRLLAKLFLWRGKYAESLDAEEKAYRCLVGKAVETESPVFEEVVEAVECLVDAYRSLGPMEGRVGGVVARDWRFKSRSVVRTLKGRGGNFDDSPAYQKLLDMLEDLKGSS